MLILRHYKTVLVDIKNDCIILRGDNVWPHLKDKDIYYTVVIPNFRKTDLSLV